MNYWHERQFDIFSHLKGLVDHQKGDRGKNILQVLLGVWKEVEQTFSQDNQDIALTKEEKQRLVQSDLKPGQVLQNKPLIFLLSQLDQI